jgi:cytochrome c oxidase subunit 4
MSEHARTAKLPHDERHRGDHVVPVATYVAVFVALMVLTVLTVAASRVNLGAFNTPLALGIAVAKAVLVILFFMHVKYSPRIIALFLAAAFSWLFLMLVGTATDYISRSPVDPRPDRPVAPMVPST